MRIRNIKNAHEIVYSCDSVIKDITSHKGNFKDLFLNDFPIHLEIGTGKGKFIYEMAENHPNINFIGLEQYASVLLRAVEKINEKPLPNLKLMLVNALNLEDIFDHEISTIYLNFSDPWPKNRHAKRRLTSPIFLDKYEKVFTNNISETPTIIQKTDNLILFASSLKNLNNHGYFFEDISLDLANTNIPNIETEYEQKFKSQGIKINYVKATKK